MNRTNQKTPRQVANEMQSKGYGLGMILEGLSKRFDMIYVERNGHVYEKVWFFQILVI